MAACAEGATEAGHEVREVTLSTQGFPLLRSQQAWQTGALPPSLKGRTGRVVVAMGMPGLVYRCFSRAHSVKALERNILGFVGMSPVHETLTGGVDSLGPEGSQRWLRRVRGMGRLAK